MDKDNVRKSKKGFTLVELLAVISILAIISLIAIGAYNGVSSNAKQKAYENKVSQIETSAAKWAKENNIDRTTSISVNKLVVEGYLTADESTENGLSKIVNPTDNKNMICNTIKISYKNGEIIASYDEKTQNCTLANQAIDDTKIKVVAYTQDTNTKLTPNSNNVLPWTNKDLTLVVSSDTYIDQSHESEKNPIIKASYDYNGNTVDKDVIVLDKNKSNIYTGTSYLSDPNTYYNAINIDASVIYNGNIVITYHFKDGSTKSKTINARIDKEEATASVIAKAEWVTSNQKVIVKADDGNGSGAKKLYIGTGSTYNSPGVNSIELCSNGKCTYEKEYEVPTIGEYNIWTEDNVGNISVYPKNKISVNNIDNTTPSCTIEFEGKVGEHGWRTEEVTPKMTTSQAGISGLYFGLSKGTTKSYSNYVGSGLIGSAQKAKQSDTTGQKYTCAVKSLAGKTNSSEETIKVDTAKPLISKVAVASKNKEYHTNIVTLTINANDLTSGVKKMCILTSNNFNDCNLKWVDYKQTTDQNTGIAYSTGGKVTFYIWVKDEAGLVSDMKNTSEYTVYQSCSVASNIVNNGKYTCGSTYSECDNICGGNQYSTKTQPRKDKFTNEACSATEEAKSQDCPRACGKKVVKNRATCVANPKGSCSSTCGTGTTSGTQKVQYVAESNNAHNCGEETVTCSNASCIGKSSCTTPTTPSISAARIYGAGGYEATNSSYKSGANIPNNGWSNGATITINNSTATGDVYYEYKIDKGTWTRGSTFNYEEQGTHTITAHAVNKVDSNKVSGEVSITLKIDTTKPTIKNMPKGKTGYDSSGKMCNVYLVDNKTTYPYQHAFYAYDNSGGSGAVRAWLRLKYSGSGKTCYGNFTTQTVRGNWDYWKNFYNNKNAFTSDAIQVAAFLKTKKGADIEVLAIDRAGNVATTGATSTSSSCSGKEVKILSGGTPGLINCNSLSEISLK